MINLKDEEIKFIKDIKKCFYNDEEENMDIKNIKNINDKDKQNNKNEDNLNNIICDSKDKKDYINSEVKENSIENNDSFN